MKCTILFATFASIVVGSAGRASAQELNLATTSLERPNILRVRSGLDHGFTAELGYDRAIAIGDRLLLAGVELAMPWAQPDLGDLQLRVGATMPLFEHGDWKLSGRLGPALRTSDNVASRMFGLGIDARLVAGYYRRRAFVAAEAGVDWTAATYIQHSDEYRMHVYPDAEDGWYRNTGGTVRAGLHGGVSFSDLDVVLRVGRTLAIDLGDQTVPFYALVGVNVAR